MSALCCRAGDSPLVAASRVTLSVQLYAELGALGLVSTMIAVAGPHPDERHGLAVAALWLAVSTGVVALGACMVSLRGLRHGNAAPRSVAAALGAGMALATVGVVIAALQNKRGHEHTSGDGRKRTRTVLAVTLLMEMSLALLRGAVWKSTSELGYPENYSGDLCEPPRHRADAVPGKTSRRWRGTSTPSSRCSYEDTIASMAWGA